MRMEHKLMPRRKFYYFGAVQAVEALHRNPVFKANWEKRWALPSMLIGVALIQGG
jgi:hypothetical protein